MLIMKLLPLFIAAAGQTFAAPADTSDQSSAVSDPVTDSLESRDKWPPEGTYKKTVLTHHNVHRKNHSAKHLTWSKNLVKSATVLAERCVFEHDVTINGGGYGQNLALGIQRSHISEAITELFYNTEMPKFAGLYGEANPPNFYDWGHFSQLVWKSTKRVGCVTHNCTKGGVRDSTGKKLSYPPYLTVCNYAPPGNFAGDYGKEIDRPLGHPTVHSQY